MTNDYKQLAGEIAAALKNGEVGFYNEDRAADIIADHLAAQPPAPQPEQPDLDALLAEARESFEPVRGMIEHLKSRGQQLPRAWVDCDIALRLVEAVESLRLRAGPAVEPCDCCREARGCWPGCRCGVRHPAESKEQP